MGANNILNLREQVASINSSTGSTIDSEEKKSDVVVEFQNVSFAYPTRPQWPVLRGLNLQVRQGQTVALVGASGCGKTTVISLLERFYDIQSGELLIYGKPLSSLSVNEYRKTVSLVSQEPTLYRGTSYAQTIVMRLIC
jgi:ATP-binding cassette subfamily B (MDR/TAP) protein 1